MADEITPNGVIITDSSSDDDEVTLPHFAVLGSGGIGSAVAKILEEQDKRLILVDLDEKKVETLHEQNFNVILGDISKFETIEGIPRDELKAAFVLSASVDVNMKAIMHLRKLLPDIIIVSRADNPADKERLESAGADIVVIPYGQRLRAIAATMIEQLEIFALSRNVYNLIREIESVGEGTLAIVTHTNPDPDAIASAVALKEIAASVGVNSSLIFGGVVGHRENEAFVNLLNFDVEPTRVFHPAEYSKIALVDSSQPGINNLLSPDTKVDIVIDHHQVDRSHVSGKHVDIRPDVGATATILAFYMRELGIPLSTEIATALMYGIRVDTNDFRRNTSPVDFMAAAFLHPHVDHELIEKISTPSISTESLDVLGDAIQNRVIYGSYLISNVGFIRDSSSLARAADCLLNLEGITTTLIFGIGADKIYISGRSRDVHVNIGKYMKDAFGEEYAGGHAALGAAQIPLGIFSGTKDKDALLKLCDEAVVKRFLRVVGFDNQKPFQVQRSLSKS